MVSEIVYGVHVVNITEIVDGIVSGVSDCLVSGVSLVAGVVIGCVLACVLWRGVL